jgi:L-asparaginase/Glu-tRNA(Gln) amidotransferase subunit D
MLLVIRLCGMKCGAWSKYALLGTTLVPKIYILIQGGTIAKSAPNASCVVRNSFHNAMGCMCLYTCTCIRIKHRHT